VARRNLRETCFARDLGRAFFMRRKAVAVHEHDGASGKSFGTRLAQRLAQRCFLQRVQHIALGIHAFRRFDRAGIKHVGQFDVQREQFRPVLVADA
jgi:hypothetical protein